VTFASVLRFIQIFCFVYRAVGTGAGKLIQGAGQGVGHVFGGSKCTVASSCQSYLHMTNHGSLLILTVSGGALQIGKGIGKGITTGDTSAVVDGFSKGVSSVGGGISQGAESAVMGAADGILSAGRGIFSGVKNIGQGIGGAVAGKNTSRFERNRNENNSSGGDGRK
jgi:phage-related protein